MYIETTTGAAGIVRGSVVGQLPSGYFANAGVATVDGPFFVSLEDVDSAAAGKKFLARRGMYLFPNVGGFYTVAKQFKEIEFTSPEGGMALKVGTGARIMGLDPTTGKIIVSLGETLHA